MQRNPKTGSDGAHATFCRICEAHCGLVAQVRDGKVASIAPDRQNPLSQGHACVKGVNMHRVTHDPDRVLMPLRRKGAPGAFEAIGWEEALDDIAMKVAAIQSDGNAGAIASYFGNPTAFSSDCLMTFLDFMRSLGSYKAYGAGSQDTNARMVATNILHGAPFPATFPDFANCGFLVIVGANPLVSNGWMMCTPRIRHDLDQVASRGRVLVVDPRRTETASRYEHLPIRPDSDVWLLLALLHLMIVENRLEDEAIAEIAHGWPDLKAALLDVDLPRAVAETGIALETMQALARAYCATPRATFYGGLGLCRGRYGMLGAFLLGAINAVGMRYGAPGGTRFGQQMLAATAKPFNGNYGAPYSRIGNLPSIGGKMPFAVLPDDILEPGEDRVRALFMSAGNPMLSAPGGERLARALRALDLFVSFDFYVNETNRFADYILPTTTFLERADWPFVALGELQAPFLQYSEAVIEPQGDARHEYWIYCEITRRLGMAAPTASPENLALAREGKLPSPSDRIDAMLRGGPAGDGFGTRPEGWSRERLIDHPHGVMVADLPDDAHEWRKQISHADGKIQLWDDLIGRELARLVGEPAQPSEKLRLIGRRDIRSINSWMHNIDKLVRSQSPILLLHPDDAARRDIASGDQVTVTSPNGCVVFEADISPDLVPGTACYPHGWGHRGGWGRANSTDGANMNLLLGVGPDWTEPSTGMSLIDCLDVDVEKNATAHSNA